MCKFSWNEDENDAQLLDLKKECDDAVSASCFTRAGASTQASRMRFANPEETLIFLDWDDTLFPTTDLFDRWGLPSRMDWDDLHLSEEQEHDLENWRQALFEFLSVLCSVSCRVAIVTNSRRPWVDACIKRFAPNLLPLFQRNSEVLKVVYAHEELSKTKRRFSKPVVYDAEQMQPSKEEFDERQTAAKFAAMRNETRAFYSRYPGQSWKNIISLGDRMYEHDALQELTFTRDSPRREQVRTKLVISPDKPTISHMTNSLFTGRLMMPSLVVHFDGDLAINLQGTPEGRLRILADALGMPELTQLQRPPEYNRPSEERVPYLSEGSSGEEFLDECAIAVQHALMD
jgi:hypothetical protein